MLVDYFLGPIIKNFNLIALEQIIRRHSLYYIVNNLKILRANKRSLLKINKNLNLWVQFYMVLVTNILVKVIDKT